MKPSLPSVFVEGTPGTWGVRLHLPRHEMGWPLLSPLPGQFYSRSAQQYHWNHQPGKGHLGSYAWGKARIRVGPQLQASIQLFQLQTFELELELWDVALKRWQLVTMGLFLEHKYSSVSFVLLIGMHFYMFTSKGFHMLLCVFGLSPYWNYSVLGFCKLHEFGPECWCSDFLCVWT